MPNTLAEYQSLYDGKYEEVLAMDKLEFIGVIMNGVREHLDRWLQIASLVHELRPRTIIDAPCGWGVVGSLLQWQRGYRPDSIVGLDVSPTSCRIAKSVFNYNETYRADLASFYTHPTKAELVMCMEMLEHVHDPLVTAMNAIGMSSKYVLFTTPNETGEVDGEFHVRKIPLNDLVGIANDAVGVLGVNFKVVRAFELVSKFTEKPHWTGWNFVLLEAQ